MKKQIIDLNKYDDEKDLKYDNRGMRIDSNGIVHGVIYMWLSDKRKEENYEYFHYCPFDEGDKVTKLMTSRNIKMTGKIKSLDRDYYGGDCLVLYVTFDKCSSKRWIKYKESLNAA